TTMLEDHDLVPAYGHHYVQLAQPAAVAPDGARSDLDIYTALAEQLGLGARFGGSPEELIDKLLEPMRESGVTREALGRSALRSPIHAVRVRLKLDPRQRPDVAVYPKGRWGSLGGPNSLIRARETDAGGGAAYYDQGVRIE